MPLIPALGRQRPKDFSEFEISLTYRVSSRTARVSKKQTNKKNYQKEKEKRKKEKEEEKKEKTAPATGGRKKK